MQSSYQRLHSALSQSLYIYMNIPSIFSARTFLLVKRIFFIFPPAIPEVWLIRRTINRALWNLISACRAVGVGYGVLRTVWMQGGNLQFEIFPLDARHFSRLNGSVTTLSNPLPSVRLVSNSISKASHCRHHQAQLNPYPIRREVGRRTTTCFPTPKRGILFSGPSFPEPPGGTGRFVWGWRGDFW